MYKLMFALLAALVLPFAAYAQQEAEELPAEEMEAPDMETVYVNRDFGSFSLDLPTGGTLETAASPDWEEDEQVVFNWFGAEGDPIVLVQARVDSFETELTQEAYDIFCDTLLSNWLNDEANYTVLDPPVPAMEDEPRRKRNQLGTHTWNLIQIDDHSDANGGQIYYSIFCTYSGNDIYTLSFYYLTPMTPQDTAVRDFGTPILESFRIAGEQEMVEEAEDAA